MGGSIAADSVTASYRRRRSCGYTEKKMKGLAEPCPTVPHMPALRR